jgi:hypothetical protein
VGSVPPEEGHDAPPRTGCGTESHRCGDCSCSGGGCSSRSPRHGHPETAEDPTRSLDACSTCGVTRWLAGRSRQEGR